MAKRREFEIALLAVLSAALPGCAGKSILPSWSSSKSTTSSQSVEDLAAKNSAASSSSNSFSSGMKKTSDSIVNALTIKPKVIPAKDPTALDGKPTKLGPEIYVSAARIHENRGDMEAASAQYAKALELAPKDVNALVGLARLHDRQGQFAEAETLYKKAAEANPKSPLVWNDLGLCYARQKRLPEATSTLSRAVQLQPNNAMYRNNVATVLVEQGRIDEAWTQLTAVNDPATAHYNMGYLLHQKQHDELAAQHLQQALAANPQLTAAQQLLAEISGPGHSEVAQAPRRAIPSYTVSDYSPPAEQTLVANAGNAAEIVNPLAPSGRRSATYRMPPTEEQWSDPAPPPARLPSADSTAPTVEEAEQGPELNLEAPTMPKFPTRRTAHHDDELQQPKNLIRLLGTEPQTAPIPSDE